MRKFLGLEVLIIMLCCGFMVVMASCTPSDNQDLKHILLQEDSAEIRSIKGMQPDNSKYTLGELIDNSLGSPTYELYDPAEDGNRYITIQGKLTYADVPVVATLQYKDAGNEKFEFYTLTFNEVPQNMLVTAQFFEFLINNCEEKIGIKERTDQDNLQEEGYSFLQTNEKQEGMETASKPVRHWDDTEYILPDSDLIFIEKDELQKLADEGGKELVRRAINEIYARHGFVFKNEKNIDYFSSKSWYVPKEGLTDSYIKENLLNDFEVTNLNRLLSIENKLLHPEKVGRRYGSIVAYVNAHPEKYSGDWGTINTEIIDKVLDIMLDELEGIVSEEELYSDYMDREPHLYDFIQSYSGMLSEPVIHSLQSYAFELYD